MLAAEKLLLLPTDMTGDFTRSDVHTLHEVRVLAIIRKMMGEGMKFDTVDNRMCIHQGRDPLEIPPPFMAITILNFHFDYWNPSLIRPQMLFIGSSVPSRDRRYCRCSVSRQVPLLSQKRTILHVFLTLNCQHVKVTSFLK